MATSTTSNATGRGQAGAAPALDEILTSTARLRVCAYLSGCEEADFKAVQDFCELTQSNLSKNVTVLAERGYVEVSKVASGRYTKTRLRLTEAGQTALHAHVAALQDIVDSARTHQGAG
ncbi:DNA-binding MarR family transcriptional regulator [Motilibacter peucedani]|uniref:DNA-binding MarR family transcriptional regulator n=1 Tax=Motilibacter peucedani TaxID=598650 RepID=A0A420XUS3_9ACTN|nr:transcriptional regulator [Motilibacter peucedani]RKS80586.1 DNA-binding MarR family transcriptional regulator [Motilibacter peucedani]